MRTIPPPCPVDDAPHTTCTSPDYVPSAPTVIVQLPARDGVSASAVRALITPPAWLSSAPAPPSTAQPDQPWTPSFTTATYNRKLHKPKST